MEITGDPPPLWPQLTTTATRRRPPSPIISLPVLIIILPIFALVLLSFVVPPFLSVTAQILKPIGVKNSWDSLNVFLVLFAIICGVLARRNDDEYSVNVNAVKNDIISEQPERISAPINVRPSPSNGVRRLKRSSSSYPDLRQESLWENNNEDRFRFFDDFEFNKYRSSMSYDDRVHELRTSWIRTRTEFEEPETKIIPVDTFVLRASPSKSPAPLTPPPPMPPPPPPRHKPRRTHQAVRQKDKNDRVEYNEIKSSPATPPPPPTPPPPRRPPSPLVSVGNISEQKHTKLQRRKSNATKEIKMVFDSLRKRKKKHKSKDYDQDYALYSPTEPPPQSPAPPPPPPPPPPSSVFQKYNLFRKSSKSKKIHSVPAPPPPPPPPPATFSFSKRSSKLITQITPPTPPPEPPPPPPRRRKTANNGRPPLPTKANITTYHDENANSGGQSPLIPMPPPSPPPPFKMVDFKFVYREDFVKIRTSPSSRCSSPDLEELVDVSSRKDETETINLMNGDDHVIGVSAVPVYFSSPDVDAKAETFIARLKDGWKLEKINSLKEKQQI